MNFLVATFAEERSFVDAVGRLREEGIERLETYTPYPVEALVHILRRPAGRLPLVVLLGGGLGLAFGLFLQWYASAVSFPINIGGRPWASWPAFLPIAFEIAVLGAVLAAFFGFCVLADLPRPHQPVAAIAGLERASRDRFVLIVEKGEGRADSTHLHVVLQEFAPCSIASWPS